MTTNERPIEVGDRFESKDRRDGGRIVEVIERDSDGYYWLRTEVNPANPPAVGTISRAVEKTLRTRYRRVSR